MGEKVSIAALCVSGLALLLVLLTPSQKAATRDSFRDVERIVLMVSAEENAFLEEQTELRRAFDNVEEMRRRFERPASQEPDPRAFAAEATRNELTHRWSEFAERLKVLEKYGQKRAPATPKK